MPTTKSKKQIGLLLSKNSPLKPSQKEQLKAELHSGAVKVGKSPSQTLTERMKKLGRRGR